MDVVNFAIIGLDHWYSALPLAQGLAESDNTAVRYIIDFDAQRAKPVAHRFGAIYSAEIDDALNDPDIDAVGCFFSVDRNPELCIRAARAGKHIISIKPLARTLDEATEMVRVIEETGVYFIPAETRSRMTPQNQFLFELVRGGKLGDIVSANFTLCGVLPRPWPDSVESGGWWLETDRAPGGAWVDHAIYQIDRLRWLLGAEPTDVLDTVANLRYPDLGMEDYGHGIFTFSTGTIATVEDTWTGAEGSWRITSTLNGSLGSLSIDTARTGRTQPVPTLPVGPGERKQK